MKSTCIALLLLLPVVSVAFAQEAVITELSGTVEIKKPDSAAWENAVLGQAITGEAIISTGFKSFAVISIGDSLINVRPLTRLSLTEISAQAGIETINAGLQAGRVQLDVKAPAGSKSIYTISTVPAVASTRGTIFEITLFELWVIEGSIEYKGSFGVPLLIDQRGYSYIDRKTERAVSPRETLLAALYPDMPIASEIFNTFKTDAAHNNDLNVTGLIHYE